MQFTISTFSFILLCCVVAVLAGCKPPFTKLGGGYEYKIIGTGSEKKLVRENYLEYQLKNFYRYRGIDSVLADSRLYMPQFKKFDSSFLSPAFFPAFENAAEGDSVVIRIAAGSFYESTPYTRPSYMQPDGFLYTTVKIIRVFNSQPQADSAEINSFIQNENKLHQKRLSDFETKLLPLRQQLDEDCRRIKDYLDSAHILHSRGKWGTFIVVKDSGKGPVIDFKNIVAVQYTGWVLGSNKPFDSNVNGDFGHQGSYEVTMSKPGSVLGGWTDGLMHLREGAKVTLYIPSGLAYGVRGWKPAILPNQNVVYEIEVKKVITEIEAMKIVAENRRRQEATNETIRPELPLKK